MVERIAEDKRSWARIGAVVVAATTTALLATPASADVSVGESAAYPVVEVFRSPSYTGYTTKLYGNDNQCTWVGSDWNDRIRSAKAYGAETVELWEHSNCTGIAIVVDSEGYWNIGPWVSAFKARP